LEASSGALSYAGENPEKNDRKGLDRATRVKALRVPNNRCWPRGFSCAITYEVEGEMITPETAIWAIVIVAMLAVVVIAYRGDGMPNVEG
jgi:hypothetical protein